MLPSVAREEGTAVLLAEDNDLVEVQVALMEIALYAGAAVHAHQSRPTVAYQWAGIAALLVPRVDIAHSSADHCYEVQAAVEAAPSRMIFERAMAEM